MPLPETDEFRLPTLEALAGGVSTPAEPIRDRVQAILGISDSDRGALPPHSPTPVFTNYVAWALVDLQRRDLIEKVSASPNTYRITERGERALADGIDLERISPRRPGRSVTQDDPLLTEAEDKPEPSPFKTRPFDPDRAPEPSDFRWVDLDQEATHQLTEKARQSHHDLLVALHEWLTGEGWKEIAEVPGSIDLWAVKPDGTRWIFEAKTIRDGNELSQTRGALAQLLEYRLIHGADNDALCLVADRPIAMRRAALLGQLGIAVLVVTDTSVDSLNELWP